MLGLVLGGGAAKGYSHIGVLKVLEEEGIKPAIVVGASMGALVGGFYAAGFTAKQLTEIAGKIDKKTKKWLFRPNLSKKGFVEGRNIVKFLSPYLANHKIEQLSIKFASIATDIENKAEVIINRGDLIQAIRASISIPIVFVPHHYSGRILIDGGFVNPVPVSVAKRLGATKIIAVNVLSKFNYKSILVNPVSSSSNKCYTVKKVLQETIELIISKLIDYEVASAKKVLLINVNTDTIGLSQFEKAIPAIELGYKAADKQRKAIKKFAFSNPPMSPFRKGGRKGGFSSLEKGRTRGIS